MWHESFVALLSQSILPSRLLLSFEGTSLILHSDKKNHRKNHGEKIQPRRGCQKWEAPSHPLAACLEEDQRVPTGEIFPAWASLTTLDRAKWKRSITELLTASNRKIIHMLAQDGLLPKWFNHLCPCRWKGSLRSMVHQDLPKYKCCAKACRSMVVPHELHPLFQVSKGKQHQTLQVQAALLLLLLLTGASHAQCRLLLKVNHKMIEGMSSQLQVLRQSYVQEEEQKIIFGDGKKWMDVVAVEATSDRADATRDVTYNDSVARGKPILWEQWCGILARGIPKTLVVKRAPGPGAIHKVDWNPLAQKHLADRKVFFAHWLCQELYRTKASGVLHDAVVHCKTKRIVRGKVTWAAPQYVRVTTHKVAKGKILKVKSGTQHIHWQSVAFSQGEGASQPASESRHQGNSCTHSSRAVWILVLRPRSLGVYRTLGHEARDWVLVQNMKH